MNAAKGVIYNESVRPDSEASDAYVSVVQLWVNLPSEIKSGAPQYLPVSLGQIQKQNLDDEAGWVKVISGEYGGVTASVPNYSNEFVYHILLEASRRFVMKTRKVFEYAAYLPAGTAIANYRRFQAGELISFTALGEVIEIFNDSDEAIDIIFFGGEPGREPIVAEETFVMNTQHEITQAYNDYYDGKYGELYQ